jgi:hypothetical protein
MSNTTFNIGLNNNPYSYEKVVEIVNRAFKWSCHKVEAQLREGLYHPNDETIIFEPTAVVRISHSMEYQDSIWAELITKALCQVFTQECIPYRHIDVSGSEVTITEELVYNDNFEGDKYTFDPAFFIDFADKVN